MDQPEINLEHLKTSLTSHLKTNFIKVAFTKKDGTHRDMICTLRPDALPAQVDLEESIPRKTNDDVMAVFDVEKQDWRSFRLDSVINWRVL
jgi:hypothetical protein